MNTRALLISSSIFYGIFGFIFTFLPEEFLVFVEYQTNPSTIVFLQVFGALYVGFTFLNWMAKGSFIGGIYNRPILIANFAHCLIVSLTLIKFYISNFTGIKFELLLVFMYSLFAMLFGILFFRHPTEKGLKS